MPLQVHPVAPSLPLSRSSLALILAILLGCNTTFAQTNSSDWTSLETLPPDCAVAVKTKAGAKYHGELVSASANALAIDSDEKASPGRAVRRREFRREEIQEYGCSLRRLPLSPAPQSEQAPGQELE